MSPTIDQHRQDLAASLRLAERFGFNEGVCNHFSFMLDDKTFLLNRHGVHWSRMKASDLVIVDPSAPTEEVEITALNIHGAIHRRHADARCVMHTHMPNATALTCLADQKLLFIHQNSVRFYEDVAYDNDYSGLAESKEEGERIARMMQDKHVLFMANHGVTVVAATIAEAFDQLYYLERACEIQVKAMSTGQPLKEIGNNVAMATKQGHDATSVDYANAHFNALKSLLDPEYVR